jgi:hypothetical protein
MVYCVFIFSKLNRMSWGGSQQRLPLQVGVVSMHGITAVGITTGGQEHATLWRRQDSATSAACHDLVADQTLSTPASPTKLFCVVKQIMRSSLMLGDGCLKRRKELSDSCVILVYSSVKNITICNTRKAGLESREYDPRDSPRWPRGTLIPQKLTLTSPASGGRSVGIVRSRTNTSRAGLESREYDPRDSSCWPRGTLYPQKLTLTSPASGGRSVGIVRWRTQATEFLLKRGESMSGFSEDGYKT